MKKNKKKQHQNRPQESPRISTRSVSVNPPESAILSLEQRRANHALATVNRLTAPQRGNSSLTAEDYARAAKQLPLRIMQTGLGQAAAYLLSKQKFGPLLADLAGWVIPQCQGRPLAGNSNERSLIEWVLQADSQTVRHATQEAVEWLLWLNRFCESQGIRGGNARD